MQLARQLACWLFGECCVATFLVILSAAARLLLPPSSRTVHRAKNLTSVCRLDSNIASLTTMSFRRQSSSRSFPLRDLPSHVAAQQHTYTSSNTYRFVMYMAFIAVRGEFFFFFLERGESERSSKKPA